MPTTWNALFLGNFADLDTDESSLTIESDLSNQSFGDANNPLAAQIATFDINDADSDGIWDRDNGGAPETSQVTEGGVTRDVQLDNLAVYNATITYDDGSTADITAVIIQLTDGSVYLAPEFSANADDAALTAAPIDTLSLGSIISSNAELVASRQMNELLPCFVRGARIRTPEGDRPVEMLKVGDLVETLDHGAQPIRWIGRATVAAEGEFAPIEIKEGAFGATEPLLVSPQHRMLIRGAAAVLYFGAFEVLAPAKALLNSSFARRRPGGVVEYYHLLFDHHEIVTANGALSESFHPGEQILAAYEDETRNELLTLFPDLDPSQGENCRPPARPFVSVQEARAMAASL